MIIHSFDPAAGIISPSDMHETRQGLPSTCIITFSKDVQEHALARFSHEQAVVIPGLNGPKTAWLIKDEGFECLLYMSPITSACAGFALEEMAQATGATHFILFGSCGALDRRLTEGHIVVPTKAYRDEGMSYHYASAADYIQIRNADRVAATVNDLGLSYVQGPVWTTDALFRETRGKMKKRWQEGCIAVDMECAGLQAICDFRGFEYFTFFYTGDQLDAPTWDARILDSGEKEANHVLAAFLVALEIAKRVRA